MKMGCTLLVVTDMERSKAFYRDVMGLEITGDFGANVEMGGRLALQTLESWAGFIGNRPVTLGGNAMEIYFETEDLDTVALHLSRIPEIRYIHPPERQSWGQRVLRFYDPDGHIIEIGEPMGRVVRRFLEEGLTVAEAAARMDVPMEYILNMWL